MIAIHSKTVTRVLLVRHGQSDFNAEGRFQGSLEEPQLTARGWKTAVACGQHLNQTHFDAIVCSSLQRARQTAEGILSTYSVDNPAPPIYYDVRLREVHLPGWEGLSMQAVRQVFPDNYRTWKEYPEQLRLSPILNSDASTSGSFSPLHDMATRAYQFWDDLLLHRRGQSVLIVGHGAAISVMLAIALRLPIGIVNCLQQSNGGVCRLEFGTDPIMPARAFYFNRTQHLGEILPKMKEGRSGQRILLLSQEHASRMDWNALLPGTSVDVIQGAGSAGVVNNRLNNREDTVRTTAWIRPCGRLGEEIVSALRLGSWKNLQLSVGIDTLSVLHYPRVDGWPILQAMNIDPKPVE